MKSNIIIPPQTNYSQAFKRQVVREYEQGILTKDAIMKKYNIGGHSTVLRWCRKYGKLHYSNKSATGRPLKDPQKRRIKQLEEELKEAREKILVYEKLIEVANREKGIDVRKNIVTKLSGNWQAKQKR
jgi:transposase-like protein